jgi:hypothetical protein
MMPAYKKSILRKILLIVIWIICLVLLLSCSTPAKESILPTITSEITETKWIQPSSTTALMETSTPTYVTTPSPFPTLIHGAWKTLPVVPTLSPEMLDVYERGRELSRDPKVVSVVGDCESSTDWFLKDFARGKQYYRLGPYEDLQDTIDYFNPSLGYFSFAAIRGANASTVVATLWRDPKYCEAGETPLSCEYRIHNPSFALIALGTNDIHHRTEFEPKMREIVEFSLEQGVIPILVTKADNLEGDESINETIARIANDYQVPLWNFWAAVQPLPFHGLQVADNAHLTIAPNFFDDPSNLNYAWPVRNLTALQVLESMREGVQNP